MEGGWQLAATKNMFPDIGVYHSHQMVELVQEMWKGIEGARHTHYYDTEGRELLSVPPMFVDMEAGFGGPTQTFSLATELIRARAAGVHLENQDPANRTCGHIVSVGKAETGQGAGPSRRLDRQAQGHQGRLPGHRDRSRHHCAHRLDRRCAPRPVVGRASNGGGGCLGGGRAGLRRYLAGVQ